MIQTYITFTLYYFTLHIDFCGLTEEHDRRIQDNQPSYLKDIQKNKIAAIRDKNCLIPLKWKKVNEKRALREESIENFNRRKEMMQSFKTVIIAQERYSCFVLRIIIYLQLLN